MQINLTPQQFNAEAVLKTKPSVIFKKPQNKSLFEGYLFG